LTSNKTCRQESHDNFGSKSARTYKLITRLFVCHLRARHNVVKTQTVTLQSAGTGTCCRHCDDVGASRGAGAIYPGGARAPPLLRVGARRGTGLEQLQMPIGKILALFEKGTTE